MAAADFWVKGIDKWGGNMVYYVLFYAREEREWAEKTAAKLPRKPCFTRGRGTFQAEKLVGRGGFFGWAKGFLWSRKGVSWEKPRVVFKKVTRGFKNFHMWFFKKSHVVLSCWPWNRTKESLETNHLCWGKRPISNRHLTERRLQWVEN